MFLEELQNLPKTWLSIIVCCDYLHCLHLLRGHVYQNRWIRLQICETFPLLTSSVSSHLMCSLLRAANLFLSTDFCSKEMKRSKQTRDGMKQKTGMHRLLTNKTFANSFQCVFLILVGASISINDMVILSLESNII
jgi:hypothetical protein